jgi:hypothetical protein
MAEWRDQTRIPKGMSDFKRWFRPGLSNAKVMPSDIDGMLHTKNGNRFLMMEFKPAFSGVTIGQRITLDGFGKLPGCTALAVFDPFSNTTDRVDYADELPLKVQLFKAGRTVDATMTVEEFNAQIKMWFDNDGLFV